MYKVKEILDRLERENNIEIIYALEAGSRAWGLESEDSDYDIRFVYKHKNVKAYLSLKPIKETLDGFSDDRIYDWQGWDIVKSLKLVRAMNPSIVEWTFSPIVYLDNPDFAHQFRTLIQQQNRVSPLLYHYRSMAKSNYKAHIENRTKVIQHKSKLTSVE